MVYAVIQGCSVTPGGDLEFQVQWADSVRQDTGIDRVTVPGTALNKQAKLTVQKNLATKINARFPGAGHTASSVRLTSTLNDTIAPQATTLFRVDTYSAGKSGRLLGSNFYTTDLGASFPTDERYTGLAQREVYAWSGSKLLSKTTTTYFVDGSIAAVETETYAVDTVTGQIVVSVS